MKAKIRVLRRVVYAVAAVGLVLNVGSSLLGGGHASAALLSSRSIQMSDSAASGGAITTGVGSGTNVTYQVTFTTTQTADSLVIDFCANNPIIAQSCTAPSGMVTTGATLTPVSGGITSHWTLTTPVASQVKIGATSSTYDAAPGTQVFDVSGITNPSTLSGTATPNGASFFARIYTYGPSPATPYTNPTVLGSYEDYGGVALSVTQTVTITATVQESLEFCVSGAAQSTWTTSYNCNDPSASTSPPAVTLGHGTPTKVLDATAVDEGTIYSQLSTNATHGAVVYMRSGNTACGGLSADNDTTCQIPAIGVTPSAIVAGTANFGMYAAPSSDEGSGTPLGSGAMTVSAPYNGGTVGTTLPNVGFGMDTTAGTGVTGPYGSEIASITGPCFEVNDAYTFGATASLTTPAGIYTDNLSMVATGTF